ncbi:MAG: [FeFe] hydrogenase H-cluster radical SAM maturase HydE [Candidatus Cloacimonetes bacterium]|jgi:biotin synthase|nr:[FeFe] hydrogenase H-cluster radical SAM maturase HydE [Candidatus Cloacimonadota bacterium]
MLKQNLEILENAEQSHILTREEIVSLLADDTINQDLFDTADRVRHKYVGDEVHLRALIEFTNICKRNCLYCGIRKGNKNVQRYRLSKEQILDFAQKAVNYGYKTIVLQGGEDAFFTAEILADIIREIKKNNVAVTLSIGELETKEYELLKNAGADRFLLRIETTDKRLYEELDPYMSHENRLRCLDDLRRFGYEVGSGCLVGLPNQTLESLADDVLFFQKIDADMIGIGPFIPNEDTPLKDAKGGDFYQALKVMAITRILLPNINIPATTAMETLNKNGRIIALQSGANVVMPNVTEGEYRQFYALYPGKICINDTPEDCKNCISGKIASIGRTISTELGFRQKMID